MDWHSQYRERVVTAEEAVRRIESGNRVVVAHACGEPRTLLRAMVAQADRLTDVEIVHMVPMGDAGY